MFIDLVVHVNVASIRVLRFILDQTHFLRGVIYLQVLRMIPLSFLSLTSFNVSLLLPLSPDLSVVLLTLHLVVHFIPHGYKHNSDGDPLVEMHLMVEDEDTEQNSQ